jgi:hypothetical protein
MNSYSPKNLVIEIDIEGEHLVFDGFACSVRIKRQGVPELPSLQARLWGLSEARMAQLTMLSFNALSLKRNRIMVRAGEGSRLSTVFMGEITNSAPDFNSAPSPVLQIEAITASFAKLEPTPPVSVNGSQSAASLVESFAKQAGFNFRNEGVTASLADCVINGDPISKAEWVANAVGADLIFEDDTVVLLPADKARGHSSVTAINPQNGQIGYPSFDQFGIRCKTFFRPDLSIGDTVQITSRLPRASGAWRLTSIEHSLSANLPTNGDWFTDFAGTWFNG